MVPHGKKNQEKIITNLFTPSNIPPPLFYNWIHALYIVKIKKVIFPPPTTGAYMQLQGCFLLLRRKYGKWQCAIRKKKKKREKISTEERDDFEFFVPMTTKSNKSNCRRFASSTFLHIYYHPGNNSIKKKKKKNGKAKVGRRAKEEEKKREVYTISLDFG